MVSGDGLLGLKESGVAGGGGWIRRGCGPIEGCKDERFVLRIQK